MELLISLLGGAIGGNVAGALLKNYSLGTIWNSVVGILGGGLGGQLLSMLGVMGSGGGSAMDIGSIVANIVSSGVGGGVLMVIVGLIKKVMAK
jgi:uncharacterized membrane protein YeaQ/YmgE (transglycosylase-associated protein family)